MTNFTKLFLYAFATGMEQLGDSQGALRRIDEILKTPEEHLWMELKESIEQAKRLKILKANKVDLSPGSLGSDINILENSETVLKELLTDSVSMINLKSAVQKQINIRNK